MLFFLLACAPPSGNDPATKASRGYPEPRPIDVHDAEPLTWEALFSPRAVHTISLRLDDDATAALAADPGSDQPAEIVIDNRIVGKGKLRMRGEATEQRWDGKPSFRIDLPRDEDGQLYAGTDELVLDAMTDDPSQARHLVASTLLSRLGVRAPTAVPATVTVNGEPFGLYTLVEVVDTLFVARHLGVAGVLWDGTAGADFAGEGLGAWEDTDPDDGHGDIESIYGVATIVQASGDDFFGQLPAVLDVEDFFRVWTALAAVGHDDAYPYAPGDVYLFQANDDPRFTFLPWAVDDGWPTDFAPGAVAGALAVRCLYDEACATAFAVALEQTRQTLLHLDTEHTLDDALSLTDAATDADPRRAFSRDEVAVARVQLAARLRVWPAKLQPPGPSP